MFLPEDDGSGQTYDTDITVDNVYKSNDDIINLVNAIASAFTRASFCWQYCAMKSSMRYITSGRQLHLCERHDLELQDEALPDQVIHNKAQTGIH